MLLCPNHLQFRLQPSCLLPSQPNKTPLLKVPGLGASSFLSQNVFCVSPLPRFLSAFEPFHQWSRFSSHMSMLTQQNLSMLKFVITITH